MSDVLHGNDGAVSSCCGKSIHPERMTTNPADVSCSPCRASNRFRNMLARHTQDSVRSTVSPSEILRQIDGLGLNDGVLIRTTGRAMPYQVTDVSDATVVALRDLTWRKGMIVPRTDLIEWLSIGRMTLTTLGLDDMGKMIEVSLVRTAPPALYVAASREVFQVRGSSIHNRHSDHLIWAFMGQCCEETRVHMHLSAQDTVIALHPVERPTVRYTVELGDVILVDQYPYRVCARMHADPVLIPVTYGAA